MIRKQILITKEQNEKLRMIAFETRKSEAEHIREALQEYLSKRN